MPYKDHQGKPRIMAHVTTAKIVKDLEIAPEQMRFTANDLVIDEEFDD